MGRIRIIAGSLRGRSIQVPEGGGVRPTADRVREALFSILADRVPGARVLDPFAGSGALGLEAISRGAARAVLVEADRRAVAVIRDNVALLAVEDRVRVVHSDVFLALERGELPGPWDLILVDPPYGGRSGSRLLRSLVAAGSLAPEAVVVVESEATDPVPEWPTPLVAGRRARYGRVALDFLRFPDSRESR